SPAPLQESGYRRQARIPLRLRRARRAIEAPTRVPRARRRRAVFQNDLQQNGSDAESARFDLRMEWRSESARKILRPRFPPGHAPRARQYAGCTRDAFRPAIRAANRNSAALNGRAGGARRTPQTAGTN